MVFFTFYMFLLIFVCGICLCVCFLCDNCALLVSWVPVIICSGGNFSYRIKTQLEQQSLNSMEEVCVLLSFCVCMCCICVSVCMPTGKSNQRNCVVGRSCKSSERGNRVAGSWEGSMWGWTGGLMQVPNSTSALGILYSIQLSLFHFCTGLLGDVVNPPGSITTVISWYICDSNQNNNTHRWIYTALYCKSAA